MFFKISKKEFYESLSTAARAISNYSPLPAFSGIKFEVSENEICLVGSDSDISIKTFLTKRDDYYLEIIKTGSIVIESKYILDIVRKIDSETIEVEILDGCTTRISGNHSDYKINGMYANEYPLIDFSKCENELVMESALLKNIIHETTFATSEKETRPVLSGVNFNCDGVKLECISTDSYRLSKKNIEIEEPFHFNITIPSKSLNEVVKSLESESNVKISISDKKVQFILDSVIVQTRLIDGLYPDTSKLIPDAFKYTLSVDLKEMISAIDRISFIKNDGVSVIRLSMNKNECILSSKSKEVGSALEVLSTASYEGEDLDISFNGKYVFESLKVIKSQIVSIKFNGEMMPFVIQGVGEDSLIELVLPVRTYA